jgi:hypothetical protein
MRRLLFVFFMMFVIWLVFYGRPYYMAWQYQKQTQENTAPAPEASIEAPMPSYVAQYKAAQDERIAAAQETPLDVLQNYSLALIKNEVSYRHDLFTLETQLLLSRLYKSGAQMDNEALAIERCLPARALQNGGFAVIRFGLERRECPPYFLKRQENSWRMDMLISRDHIGFNAQNQWYFMGGASLLAGEYGFAFSDVIFDEYGYPH